MQLARGETEFFKHIAATSGDARGEFWGLTELAKSWFGPWHVCFAIIRAQLSRQLHLLAGEIRYAFRPNGQGWWWLTAIMLTLPVIWVYTR